jgi:hypothetical protein
VVRSMPMRPDSYVLGALLNVRVRGAGRRGRRQEGGGVGWRAEQGGGGHHHTGVHVQLSNMYAAATSECGGGGQLQHDRGGRRRVRPLRAPADAGRHACQPSKTCMPTSATALTALGHLQC